MSEEICDLERLYRSGDFKDILLMNDMRHIRVNGVIDFWPSSRRWMPTGSRTKSKRYANYEELRKIILEATVKRHQVMASIAALPADERKKEEVRGIKSHEEFKRLFG